LPYCSCAGKCLADPVKAGDATYPDSGIRDGLGFVDPNNFFLPGRFDWQDVEGAQSYYWRAIPVNPSSIITQVNSPFLSISEHVPGSCSLKSGEEYSWQVQPCCSPDGNNCKNWTDLPTWIFTTNLAAEPISPIDPDWNNTTQAAQNVSIPVSLEWCELEFEDPADDDYHEEVLYYHLLRFYIVEGGVEECHPWAKNNGDCAHMEVGMASYEGKNKFEDRDSVSFFIQDSSYRWEIATCISEGMIETCSDFGQKWGFETETLPFPSKVNLLSPANDPAGTTPVEIPTHLTWESIPGIHSFVYEINGGSITGTVYPPKSNTSLDLSLDSIYNWRVMPCWDYEGKNCISTAWSDIWHFRTTGAPPTLTNPPNGEIEVLIPTELSWSSVSGAKSYKVQIREVTAIDEIEKLALSPKIFINYPDLKTETAYRWRVKTCADLEGNLCGDWSSAWVHAPTFATLSLAAPINPNPSDGYEIKSPGTLELSWDPVTGAGAYNYVIRYRDTGEEILNKIVSSNSASLQPFLFSETGWYEWEVRACLNDNCNVDAVGDWSDTWSFDLSLTAPASERTGLVPCGRDYDNPNTHWNERDSCQIYHFFLMIRNVLEFVLWKIATILLVLVLVFAAALLYVSAGEKDTIFKIRSFAKAIIIGYFIIFFSWLIINLLLSFLGFQFQLFGNWWEIRF
jgi:hypothetical protein